MEKIPRSEAKALGLPRYYTGRPCKNGHIAERYVAGYTCVECHAQVAPESNRAWRERSQSHIRQYARRYREIRYSDPREREARCQRSRQWYQRNKDRASANTRNWIENNSWYKTYNSRRYQAAKQQAIPKWYPAERHAIAQLYRAARELTDKTGVTHHVDHTVPLRGKNVCGLHTLVNLQILTADENRDKSNKH